MIKCTNHCHSRHYWWDPCSAVPSFRIKWTLPNTNWLKFMDDWRKRQATDDWQRCGIGTGESHLLRYRVRFIATLFFRANQISGFFKDMIPPTLMAQLLDTTYLCMWETFSSTECLQPKEDTNYDPVLTNEKCQMGQDELRQMMLLSTSESVSNKDKENDKITNVGKKGYPEPDTPPEEETQMAAGATDPARVSSWKPSQREACTQASISCSCSWLEVGLKLLLCLYIPSAWRWRNKGRQSWSSYCLWLCVRKRSINVSKNCAPDASLFTIYLKIHKNEWVCHTNNPC